ncbi:MAG: type I-U CRISPR-associated protein Csb2 [Pirellulaceae bacterium]|nr:type I-U CRISPR-associated protein Csb2 [Pirellulaceae bacterium]
MCWQICNCDHPLPFSPDLHVTRTLPIAESVHRALVGLAGNGQLVDCPELIGQDRFGQPMGGGHEHAKILPLDLDGDLVIDHVLLHSPMGLGEVAWSAIRALRMLRLGSRGCVGLRLVASDQTERAFVPELFPAFQGATSWTSVTPYVPPRYLKKSGKNSLVGQIQTELATRSLPAALLCEVVPEVSMAMRRFVRTRREGKLSPPQDVGFGLRLEFAQPVSGPVALGYASHFGLGWFAAIQHQPVRPVA